MKNENYIPKWHKFPPVSGFYVVDGFMPSCEYYNVELMKEHLRYNDGPYYGPIPMENKFQQMKHDKRKIIKKKRS